MKRIYWCLIACLTVCGVMLSGCAGKQDDSDVQPRESRTETVSSDSKNDEESALQIRVESDSESIIFALNDSSAARSLYDQLPLTLPVEDCSTNEKIFCPPEELDVSEAPQAGGPAGTLAGYEVSAQGDKQQQNISSAPTDSTSPESETLFTPSAPAASEETEDNMRNIEITVYGESFTATLNDNEAARAFAEMLPLTLDMSDYSGFEKVASLGTNLPTDNRQTITQSGDIVLYNGNQIVIFCGSNSWSYTRLGKIDDLSGWKEALGNGDVTVIFSLED